MEGSGESSAQEPGSKRQQKIADQMARKFTEEGINACKEEVDIMLETALARTVDRKRAVVATICTAWGCADLVLRSREWQGQWDIRRLTARYKDASEEERPTLTELRKKMRFS
ncbi:hypothetical protein DPMN_015426 [Dreissena polymorpha]|uniref:Uncharacterized protein n=1 Tax=Dreissena polymorpha TaxID=45954 RepID=A0A9D4S658_DREPO|nr:hypothetical protein DPMN_015426 [Dreissena polymorpha]